MKYSRKKANGDEVVVELDPRVERTVARLVAWPSGLLLVGLARALGLWP